MWFYGKLACQYLDDLCNDFDDRFERKLPPTDQNRTYPLDPSRRSGLSRAHPFVKLLFGEALKKLRPLIEEERKREEKDRARIESEGTRKRLNALEKAALEFVRDFGEDETTAVDPEGKHPDSSFTDRGYSLSPPFDQIVVGQSRRFTLSIRHSAFAELEVGSTVQIECLSPEILADTHYCGLEPHPAKEDVLRASWKVKAMRATSSTGLRARVGTINAESTIEVFALEADRCSDVTDLRFSSKRYRMRIDQKRKKVRILAPISQVPERTQIEIDCDSRHFDIVGSTSIFDNSY